MFFTTRVSRCCRGSVTEAKHRPVLGTAAAFARCKAGMTVRMFAIPTCGLLRGSGRWPVAQPSTAGGAAQTET